VRRALALQTLLVLVIAGGCASNDRTPRAEAPGAERPSEQAIAAVLDTHNERVEQIGSLWARVSVRVRGLDAQGDRFEEQGEGHLQIRRPRAVSLTIGKLGTTYFSYGSNADLYWMIDVAADENRAALVGEIDAITRDKAAAIGLSVHPGDLVGVLGIESIDRDAVTAARWIGAQGTLALTVPARWGAIEYAFDTRRALPVTVRHLDQSGAEIATASLSNHKDLLDERGLDAGIDIPGTVEITTPDDAGGYLRLGISSPAAKTINPVVFDFDRLRRLYRVERVVDLDRDPGRVRDRTGRSPAALEARPGDRD